MPKFSLSAVLTLCLLAPGLRGQQSGVYVIVADAGSTVDADRLVSTLSRSGYTCNRVADQHVPGLFHVRVGPYASETQAESVRASFRAAGYQLPGEFQAASHQSSLEAEALANLGDSATSAPPASGAELEAQALSAMKENEIDSERQQQMSAARERQQAANRAANEARDAQEQANAPEPEAAPESRSVTLLKALNGALGQVNDSLAQQNDDAAARNAQLQAQANAQVAANNARREQSVTQQPSQLTPHPAVDDTFTVDYGTGPGSYPTGTGSAGTATTSTASSVVETQAPATNCLSNGYVSLENVGMMLRFNNSCAIRITLEYWISGHGYEFAVDPGGYQDSGYTFTQIQDAGGFSSYACPDGWDIVGPDGHMLKSALPTYHCAKRN